MKLIGLFGFYSFHIKTVRVGGSIKLTANEGRSTRSVPMRIPSAFLNILATATSLFNPHLSAIPQAT